MGGGHWFFLLRFVCSRSLGSRIIKGGLGIHNNRHNLHILFKYRFCVFTISLRQDRKDRNISERSHQYHAVRQSLLHSLERSNIRESPVILDVPGILHHQDFDKASDTFHRSRTFWQRMEGNLQVGQTLHRRQTVVRPTLFLTTRQPGIYNHSEVSHETNRNS